MQTFPTSELIINGDGSIFHLHIRPEQLADRVVMMGDPERVPKVAAYFDSIEFDSQSREFRTITGSYKGKRITAISHGIGCDNIDIVMNELDSLANIDFVTRTVKPAFRQLSLVRIGTSGGLQPTCPIGSYVVSDLSMGMDGLLYFYKNGEKINLDDISEKFVRHTSWNKNLARPYFVAADRELAERIGFDMVRGITVSASGFYAPQGRQLRMENTRANQNELIESFEYGNLKICNYEMEGAALAGLAGIMGHRAMTVCLIIAGRYSGEMNTNYKGNFDELIVKVLDRI